MERVLTLWQSNHCYLFREHQEEIAKRTAGAAIAPPKALVDEDSRVESPTTSTESTASEMPPPSFIPSFGAGKGLGVAANIMSKFGYKVRICESNLYFFAKSFGSMPACPSSLDVPFLFREC